MGLFKRLLDSEYKELKRFERIADDIISLDEEMQKLKTEDFAKKTNEFKERLKNGETLDDILVEAFALAREAAARTINEKAYYVQLLVLHKKQNTNLYL